MSVDARLIKEPKLYRDSHIAILCKPTLMAVVVGRPENSMAAVWTATHENRKVAKPVL